MFAVQTRPLNVCCNIKQWFDALIIAVRCAPSWCQLQTGTLDKYRFYLSLYPPGIPLKKGEERSDSCPPDALQAPGDRSLTVKQQTGITFNVFVGTKKGARFGAPYIILQSQARGRKVYIVAVTTTDSYGKNRKTKNARRRIVFSCG